MVDIVSDHYYPLSLDTLLESAEMVSATGLPFIIGEIGWSKAGTEEFLEAVETLRDDGLLAGSLFWSMFGHAETFGNFSLSSSGPTKYNGGPGHVTHGDGYSLYWPNGPEPNSFHHNNPAFKSLMQTLSDHMFRMADSDIPETYLMSDILPVITLLECQPEQWVR